MGTVLTKLLIVTDSAFAQPLAEAMPDAGVLQRQIEAVRQSPIPAPIISGVTPKPEAKSEEQSPKVKINSFEINGSKLIESKELLALIQNQIGQSLNFSQLEQLTLLISDYYRSKGWFARVYLPEQDVSAGKIIIHIIEAEFSGTQLEPSDTRADRELISRIVSGDLQPGQAFAIKTIESGLLKANDLPGIKTIGILEPGQQTGQTGVRLKIEDLPLVSAYLNYANQGVRSIGSNQYQGSLQLNDPLGRGDQFSLHALGSENLVSIRGEYGWVVGPHGERFSIYGSHLQYELGGSFTHLKAAGEARNIGGALTYPLIRETERNLSMRVALDNKFNQSGQLGHLTRVRDINTAILSINADQIDHSWGSAFNSGSLQFTAGNLNLDALKAEAIADRKGPNAGGDFYKLNLNLNRLHNLADQWQLSLGFNAQLAFKNLDSSQKFSLGGPSGVRAYPVNEGMGDSGWMLNVELRRQLGFGIQALVFADTGGVLVNQQMWSSARTSTPNSYMLSGVGLGLRWTHKDEWQASATVGLPLTTNPGSSNGQFNGDGTRASDPSGWLSLTHFF